MITLTDSIGHTLHLSHPPARIVSLVPSLTELIADLGAESNLVGITKFCIHPKAVFHSRTRVGGTKQVHLDRIDALNPDLIIANKEENVKEQIELLQARYPVYTSSISNIPEACATISEIGRLINRAPESVALRTEIEDSFRQICQRERKNRIKILYLIWKQPYMSVGGDTFIHDMLEHAGFENCCASMSRYPIIESDWIKDCQADAIWLSSEPFPFKESHGAELQALLPTAKVQLVDGEYFSWYGSRMKKAAVYLKSLQSLYYST